MSVWGTVYQLERDKIIGRDPETLLAEIERLRTTLRLIHRGLEGQYATREDMIKLAWSALSETER